MNSETEVTFKVDILGLNRDNVKEKILPYINELVRRLIVNECENVRVSTKIRILKDKEVEAFITITDY